MLWRLYSGVRSEQDRDRRRRRQLFQIPRPRPSEEALYLENPARGPE